MPQHVNPGLDTTINPIVIDDSYREKKIKEPTAASCRTCSHYQPGLNPYGCFKRYHSTGYLMRVLISIFGCKAYDYNPKFKEE